MSNQYPTIGDYIVESDILKAKIVELEAERESDRQVILELNKGLQALREAVAEAKTLQKSVAEELEHDGILANITGIIIRLKGEGEGNFYCTWCGNMKPVSERVIEKEEGSDMVTWIVCLKCHKRRG